MNSAAAQAAEQGLKKGEASGSRDRKAGLSCAECRRSKLKCDRVFPCQSCVKRGCAAICPDGTLAATKGNKVLMAHAQRLNEQVKSQNVRIKELEQALANARPAGDGPYTSSREPALKGSADKVGDRDGVYNAGVSDVSESFGSLAIGLDGQAKYYGETAGSEYFNELLEPACAEEWKSREPRELGLPYEIADLVKAFPFGSRDTLCSKQLFIPFIPPRERTMVLTDLYYENAAWMYDPIARWDFMKTIMDPIYGTTGIINVNTIHSHRLSVFFVILATAMLYDSHPSAEALAEQYYALSRAALALEPIFQEATSAAVQALFGIIRYIYTSDRTSNDLRWMLCGLCTRVGQLIGLQRDSAGWGLDNDEIQRRRIVFWELYTYDAWTSVVHGRPPSLSIEHTDTCYPDDLDKVTKPSGEVEIGWHAWKFRYSATCLSVSVQHVFSTQSPSYTALLELDKKIRQFPLPGHLQSPIQASEAGRSWSANSRKAMQQYCVVCERESNLLYIHRSSFAQAIREASQNPLVHKFAPSVLATYRSACRLISSLKGLYAIHPILSSRIWFFWSAIFSSCIVLGALVVESPGCTLAQNAMHELEQTLLFYEEGSRPCRPSATLTMLQRLRQRAHTAFTEFYAGTRQGLSKQTQPSPTNPAQLDELEVLGGRKSVITKSPSDSPASQGTSGSDPSSQGSLSMFPEGNENATTQMCRDVDPLLMEYDSTVGPSGFLGPEGNDFAMGFPGGGYSVPPRVVAEPPRTQNFPGYPSDPVLFAAMQAPQYPSSQVPVPSSQSNFMPVTHEQNQDEIWRNFMSHLGLNSA